MRDLVAEFEVIPKNTYDFDETGFVMGNIQSQRVLDVIWHPRNTKGRPFPPDLKEFQLPTATRIQDGSREFATMICCICADGTYLPSAVIMKGQGLQDTWFQNLDGVPRDVLFGVSPNGWTDNGKALAWLQHNFGPEYPSEKKAAGKWRMLIFDGHISHVNREFLSTCLDYKVLPVCLPPHTTHFSQPLDVALFAPLKAAYSDVLRRHTESGEHGIWKGNFYRFLLEAEKIAFTSENIRSGFWWTGPVPLDFEVLGRTIGIKEPTATKPVLSCHLSYRPPLQFVHYHLFLRPKSSQFPPPRDHQEFHQLRESLELDLKSNSPRS